MKTIEKVKLFINHNKKSYEVGEIVKKKLLEKHFEIVEEGLFDLGIAIGGDGAFLRMVKHSEFNEDCYYVGVHTGTLGFAQEISITEIDSFIEMLDQNEFFYEKIGVQEIEITTQEETFHHFSLNEVVCRDQELNTTKLKVLVENHLLEEYIGDGLLVSTSFGSTAYNLSFGGSIVFNTFHTLQITPIAPLNSKSYRNLLNSVIIPDNKVITLIPTKEKENLLINIDGDNYQYNHVKAMKTHIGKRNIHIIRKQDYNFIDKINDKFLR